MDTYYLPGAHNKICDRTGYKVKSTQTRKEWNGSIVRDGSWEPRHPIDLLRSIPDDQSVQDPRSESTDRFLGVNEVTADSLTGTGSPDTTTGANTIWDNGGTIWDASATVWD